MTFESFITPEGIVVSAGIITALVQLIKTVFPSFYDRVNGLQQAFILSAVLYVLTAVSIAPDSPNGYLVVFASWLACATSAVGFFEAASRTVNKLSDDKPKNTIIGPTEKFDDE